jgi:hypothetical protein
MITANSRPNASPLKLDMEVAKIEERSPVGDVRMIATALTGWAENATIEIFTPAESCPGRVAQLAEQLTLNQ